MGKKKKFIDKKKAVTFHLVHRSQQDPLVADETAPQHVLVQSNEVPQPAQGSSKSADPKKRKEEQRKFGVYFDDDYDYLQHLKDAEPQVVHWVPVEPRSKESSKPTEPGPSDPKLKLPSSVFASEFEEDEGLLRRAIAVKGPRPDWDPDIVEALDDDFDFDNPDNQLDDDFVTTAMQEGEFEEEDEGEWTDDVDSDAADYSGDDEDGDRLGPLRGFGREETRSRFTEYSMSSSVIRRNEQLSLLDDKFEKFYEQYDDLEVGALDAEEIQGAMDETNERLLEFATEFNREHKLIPYEKSFDVARLVKMQQEYESEPEEMVELEVSDEEKPTKKWDCESILSTYSNLYNHPKLIVEPARRKISINEKTGIPKNVLEEGGSKLTARSLAKLGRGEEKNAGPKSLCAQSVVSTLSVLSIRPKDESCEEKKERKKLLKEYRAERRIERKVNALAFKEEKARQDKIKANNSQNLQGKKIL